MSQRRWHQNSDWSDWGDWSWSYPSWHHDWHNWHGWQDCRDLGTGEKMATKKEPRSQPSRQRERKVRKVGVYFGTFDPIHENHVGLAKFACDHGYVELVYFVVNGDNPMKLLASIPAVMCHFLLETLALVVARLFNLSREEAQQMRWRDREDIGERIRNEAEKELGKVQVFQLQGQDSFEKAGQRVVKEKANMARAFGPRVLISSCFLALGLLLLYRCPAR
eukprot:s247_g36.t1